MIPNKERADIFIKIVIEELGEKINRVDGAALEMLKQQYNLFLDATLQLETAPLVVMSSRGIPQVNPLVKIQKDAVGMVTKLLQEFGLTTKSRVSIDRLSTVYENNKPIENPFLELFEDTNDEV